VRPVLLAGRGVNAGQQPALQGGDLQALLDANAVNFARDKTSDPYSFLPSWLHPRQ
jgi:hypothetical protein